MDSICEEILRKRQSRASLNLNIVTGLNRLQLIFSPSRTRQPFTLFIYLVNL